MYSHGSVEHVNLRHFGPQSSRASPRRRSRCQQVEVMATEGLRASVQSTLCLLHESTCIQTSVFHLSTCIHEHTMCPYMSTYICHVSTHACYLHLHVQCMVGVSACTYACYMSTCAPATCVCTYICVFHCLHEHIYGFCVCVYMHVTLVHAHYVYCIAYVSVYTYKLFACTHTCYMCLTCGRAAL